jgi:hypothetical protein
MVPRRHVEVGKFDASRALATEPGLCRLTLRLATSVEAAEERMFDDLMQHPNAAW